MTSKTNMNGEKISLSEIFQTWLKESTSHGIPKLVQSKTLFMKLIWLICTFFSFIICVNVIISAVLEYLKYDTITTVNTIIEIPSLFPAITLCNLNPFQNDFALSKFYYSLNKFETINNVSISQKLNDVESRIVTLNFFSSLDDTNKTKLANSFNQTVLKCSFNVEDCDENDFEWYFDNFYGNCFRFNTGKDKKGRPASLKQISQAGDVFGLRLELFVGDTTKTPDIFKRYGFQVIINNQTNYPSFNEGTAVSAGMETNIRINRVFHYQLEPPYNDCLKKLTLDAYSSDLYRLIMQSNRTYRQKDCFMLCVQSQVIQKCECYFNLFDKLNGKTMCKEINQLECALKTAKEIYKNNITAVCSKECPVECNSISYMSVSSVSQFPNKQYMAKLVKTPAIADFFTNKSVKYEDVKESFLAVNIYYEELSFVYIGDEPKMKLVDLISNIGGLLGLFMGLSFLSLVELIEILVEILFWMIRERKDSRVIRTINEFR